jgi:hypothetical protein
MPEEEYFQRKEVRNKTPKKFAKPVLPYPLPSIPGYGGKWPYGKISKSIKED